MGNNTDFKDDPELSFELKFALNFNLKSLKIIFNYLFTVYIVKVYGCYTKMKVLIEILLLNILARGPSELTSRINKIIQNVYQFYRMLRYKCAILWPFQSTIENYTRK